MQKLAVVLFCVILTGCPHGSQAFSPKCEKPGSPEYELEAYCDEKCYDIIYPFMVSVQKLQDELKWRKMYPGFEKLGYGIFYIEQVKTATWEEAVAICHKMGAQLGEYDDGVEFEMVKKNYTRKGTYWQAIRYWPLQTSFKSNATGLPARYLNWDAAQPSTINSQVCTATRLGQSLFTDVCDEEYNYICKVDLPLKKK
uniref:ACP23D4b n=1 Tax=Drosophila yakuba TaxID=7245 RepID=Q45WD2_DROYA|nr:ACP23D4b [Drosophila yakuba]